MTEKDEKIHFVDKIESIRKYYRKNQNFVEFWNWYNFACEDNFKHFIIRIDEKYKELFTK